MVIFGEVETFDRPQADKAQSLKVLEEAAEVFGAVQAAEKSVWDEDTVQAIVDECADVVYAVANMMAALGVKDMRPYIADCMWRNVERGRIRKDG